MHQFYKVLGGPFYWGQNGYRPPNRRGWALVRFGPGFGSRRYRIGGAKRDRTADPLRARQVLSQLSYSPSFTGLFYAMRRCTCRPSGHLLM